MAVGDGVEIIINEEGQGLITAIDDRKNYIIRRATNLSKQSSIIACNLDQAFLVVTGSPRDLHDVHRPILSFVGGLFGACRTHL